MSFGSVEFTCPVKAFSRHGNEDLWRIAALIYDADQLSRRVDPRAYHLVAVAVVPAPLDVQYVLPRQIDHGIAAGQAAIDEVIPCDAPPSRRARDQRNPVAARL